MVMYSRLFIAVFIIMFFAISLLTPVSAQDSQMLHSSDYLLDGRIDFKKQAGHLCNTGAEKLQVITGDGQIEKNMSVVMIEGKIELEDSNEFTTDIDALNNLSVTTAIELCTPPKYSSEDSPLTIYERTYRWEAEPLLDDPLWLEYWENIGDDTWEYRGKDEPSAIDPRWEGQYEEVGWSAYYPPIDLTKQIWAVSVSANPNNVGLLNTNFTAAYAPPMWSEYEDPDGRRYPYAVPDHELVDDNRWASGPNNKIYIGPEFIGDYFEIEQYSYVSDGELKRYIDISSPYSHALLHEDMVVSGLAEVEEAFFMQNILPGENIIVDWWDILYTGSLETLISSSLDQHLLHSSNYTLEGFIDYKKQAGHLCNTGGEMKQKIIGEGQLEKVMDIEMLKIGLLAVSDHNEFSTSPDATKNLTVSSVIELCAPPKQYYKGDRVWLYHAGIDWPNYGWQSGPYGGEGASWWHGNYRDSLVFGPYFEGDFVEPLLNPDGLHQWHGDDESYSTDVSDQIWAISVEAYPGETGLIDMSFEAAHGPFGGHFPDISGKFVGTDDWGSYDFQAPSYSWWTSTDGKGVFPVVGKDYVGSLFKIDQVAQVTDGTLKRYIDISSPWSHGYLHEDITVTGKAEIRDIFELQNLPPGNKDSAYWWDIIESDIYNKIDDYYLSGLRVENFSGTSTGDKDYVIRFWLEELLYYADHENLIDEETYGSRDEILSTANSLYLDGKWNEALDLLENAIDSFNRKDGPDPDNLIKLPPFILMDFPIPHVPWDALF